MQENNKKRIIKKLSKKNKIIILVIAIILVASCIIAFTTQIIRKIQIKKLENKPLLEYEIKNKIDSKTYEILIRVNSIDGIENIKYINPKTNDEVQLKVNGKLTVGIDYTAIDKTNYEFKIKINGKSETTENLYFEIPRIKGNYSLNNGLYVNEPDLTGYNKNYTRYLNINGEKLEPGNWINGEKPENWYNYKTSNWANIYVENNGLETYYVWIPRYCFKLDQANQRSDVKFIDVYNNYQDENGNVTTWEELEKDGYQVPEAFEFNHTQIPGYWANKYTAGEKDSYTIDFDSTASKTKVKFRIIRTNTTENIAKYTYAINGIILKESTIPEEFEYEINTENINLLNITALNENGEIIGSMTKECKQAKVNDPDINGFNKETTFYVTYDENGIESSVIPLTEEKPENWYDYGDSKWANIVTRNNELETYYVWIPRYEFKLDQTAQRSIINFMEGTKKEATTGYQIPEAFTFNGQELTGYWAMKYTAGSEAAPKFDTEVVATSSSIKTKGITGTSKAEGQVYRYYINGQYKGEKTTAEDAFEFTGLNSNTKYTILVEIRESSSNKHLGAVLKQISTIDANKPELSGFKEENTYYVLYDSDGNETIGDKIKKDGSNMPNNWYNYSESKWANIVVKNGNMKTYYTWIPRYEFMITSSQQAQPAQGRTEVRFIKGTSTDVDVGYQIPEAFTFNGQELTGYWAMKYTAGE